MEAVKEIKTINDLKKVTKRDVSIGGGGNNDDSKNSGDGNDGETQKNNPFGDNLNDFKPETSRILMWFLLLIVFMTFGGLIGAYIVLATNKAMEWQPFQLPIQIWVSTALIIAGTITYEVSNRLLIAKNQEKSRTYLLIATTLGGIFIASQILAWLQLVSRGVYVSGNPYAGLFYILTATHALHVIGGIIALGYMVLRTKKPTALSDEMLKRQSYSRVIGWYWHFMDVLWLVLVFLLAFWK
jgi:cytochrome c oxidase subunit III